MAKITGVGGSITFATGYTTNIKSWTITGEASEHDVTDFTSVGWTDWITGLKNWSGTYEGWADDTAQLDANANWFGSGTAAAATFAIDAARTFTGSILIKGFSADTAVSDPVTVTFSFRGTGQLTVN